MSFIRSVIRCVRLVTCEWPYVFVQTQYPYEYAFNALHTSYAQWLILLFILCCCFFFFSLIFFAVSPYFVSAGGRHQLTNILLCASRIVFSYFVRCFLSLPFLRASAILLFSHRCRCSLVSWRSFVCWLFFHALYSSCSCVVFFLWLLLCVLCVCLLPFIYSPVCTCRFALYTPFIPYVCCILSVFTA